MRDLRLLAPAAIAWATAWCVVAAPDSGIDPVPVAWVIWVAGGGLLGALLVTQRRTGESTPAAVRMRAVAVGLVIVAAAAGLVELSQGARVIDAVAAAGGFTAEADPAAVNLARPVVDGEQLAVLAVGQAPPQVPGSGGGGATGPAADGTVHLNTADLAALDTLPRIGPALAQRIIDWREANGPFTSVDQLLEVAGIGDAVFSGLADRVAP